MPTQKLRVLAVIQVTMFGQKPTEKPSKFWVNEPVIPRGGTVEVEGVLDPKEIDDVQKDPYRLVKGFSWSQVDTSDPAQREELYEFLRQHYVTHPQNSFTFAYSAEFLNWALHAPGWRPEYLVGLRADQTGKLAAFISAIPASVIVRGKRLDIVAVDFLSIHHKLRSRNLAPLMIRELTRRVNLAGIFQAIYTVGKVITEPVCATQYYHRLVSYEKLVAIKFTAPETGASLQKQITAHRLPTLHLDAFRVMIEEDVPVVTVKLNEYLAQFKFSQVFDEAQVAHWFLPRQNIVGSYVFDDKKEGITGFISFYVVPSTVKGVPQYTSYTSAYLFYYFAKPSQLTNIARAAMEVAHHQFGADVINCLNVLHNEQLIGSLKFVPGDGKLHYYLYNYATEAVKGHELGVVLL
jgi:glycylpeptide N-tetradecanoyltransferase